MQDLAFQSFEIYSPHWINAEKFCRIRKTWNYKIKVSILNWEKGANSRYLANIWNSQLFQIVNRYQHFFIILYLVWSPFSTILFHQILFSNVILVYWAKKFENLAQFPQFITPKSCKCTNMSISNPQKNWLIIAPQ